MYCEYFSEYIVRDLDGIGVFLTKSSSSTVVPRKRLPPRITIPHESHKREKYTGPIILTDPQRVYWLMGSFSMVNTTGLVNFPQQVYKVN